jgi:hypothetical protein
MRLSALTVILLLAGFAGFAGAAWYQRQTEWSDAETIQQRERDRCCRLDALREQRDRLVAFCDQQVFALMTGRQHLAQACRNVEAYAAVHYPAFLDHVNDLGQGRTLREKVADNLLKTFLTPAASGWQYDSALAWRMVLELNETAAP